LGRPRRRDREPTDPTTVPRVESTEDVDPAFDPPGASLDRLETERFGQAFDREARVDRVAVQVDLAVQLRERHLAHVAGEDGERDAAEVLSA
jgi:hypothetical protein